MVKLIIEVLAVVFILIVFVTQIVIPIFTPGKSLFPFFFKDETEEIEPVEKGFKDLEELDKETEEAMKKRNEVVSGIEAAQEKLKSIISFLHYFLT